MKPKTAMLEGVSNNRQAIGTFHFICLGCNTKNKYEMVEAQGIPNWLAGKFTAYLSHGNPNFDLSYTSL